MDNDQERPEKKVGSGRGSIIMKMIKMKEEAEARAAIQKSTEEVARSVPQITQPASISDTKPNVSHFEPTSSASIGRGRASLLGLMKAMKSLDTPPSKPDTSVSQGRASILSLAKGISTLGQTSISEVPSTSGDKIEVTANVSKLSVHNISSTTSTSFHTYEPTSRQGTTGKEVQLAANYINLKFDAGKGRFLYEVKFTPDIDSRPLRRKLLNQHLVALGRTKIFDGVLLYLPQKLPEDKTNFESLHPMDGSKVLLKLIFKTEQSMAENVTFFNVLLGRVMRALSLVRIGQHSFNPKAITSVPQHRLEVWPGYVTAINEYDGGLKLCIDAKHRVMRTETVRDLMLELRNKPDFKDAVIKEVVGMSVFTRYNNKTYRVDDIDWTKTPKFEFQKCTDKMSLIDYYKTHWNLQIKDEGQPLLVHVAKDKLPTGTQEKMILLVPELCYIAGLTDNFRSDTRVMRDLDTVTKVSPDNRRDIIRNFVQAVQRNDVAREILAEWGLHLENDVTNFTGRVLDTEVIFFGHNKNFKPPAHRPADWTSAACGNPVLRTPHLRHWYLLYTHTNTKCSREFVSMLKKVSQTMGINITDPQMIILKDDRTETYVRELRNIIRDNVNLVVAIVPSNRTDRYTAIKRICYVEMPVPSQVIVSRTISRGDKLKSVTEKITLQMNCKLGGALWALTIPLENCMICGIDVYHAAVGQKKGSVAGFVASLDKLLTTWHSKVCFQGQHQELVDLLQICLVSAMKAYCKHNGHYPDRIIIYRDGVGDGQIDMVAKYEVKQILATIKNIDPNYRPKLTVIIVQKRINTRLFAHGPQGKLANPPPGTIVDTCITRLNLHDFYLVSQNIRQGTVTPTRYIVVYDSADMKADYIQRLSYKLCHLYYNWSGTIKVPAPCQYAHRLVYLVGQNIQQEPHQSLSDTLFYL